MSQPINVRPSTLSASLYWSTSVLSSHYLSQLSPSRYTRRHLLQTPSTCAFDIPHSITMGSHFSKLAPILTRRHLLQTPYTCAFDIPSVQESYWVARWQKGIALWEIELEIVCDDESVLLCKRIEFKAISAQWIEFVFIEVVSMFLFDISLLPLLSFPFPHCFPPLIILSPLLHCFSICPSLILSNFSS